MVFVGLLHLCFSLSLRVVACNQNNNNNNIKLISYNRDLATFIVVVVASVAVGQLPLLLLSISPDYTRKHCCNNCNCNSLLIMRNYLLTFTSTGCPKKPTKRARERGI